MKSLRTHRSPLALLLAGLVLLGALACSTGHGRMLAALMPGPAADLCGVEAPGGVENPGGQSAMQAAMQGSGPHSGHALFMQLALFDCAFASQLASVLPGIVVLGWLLRALRHRSPLPERRARTRRRHDSPGRVAQAP